MSGLTLTSVGLPLAAAMLVVGYIGWRSQPWTSALALVLLVWVWLRVDRRFEGSILARVSTGHGLVVADLFGLAVLGWAAVLVARAVRATSRH